MTAKIYVFVSGVVYLSLLVLHVFRLTGSWAVEVNGVMIPNAWSVFMLIFSLLLLSVSYSVFKKLK